MASVNVCTKVELNSRGKNDTLGHYQLMVRSTGAGSGAGDTTAVPTPLLGKD